MLASSAFGSRIRAPPVPSRAPSEHAGSLRGTSAGSSSTARMEFDLQNSTMCCSRFSPSLDKDGSSAMATRSRKPGRRASDCAAASSELRNVSGIAALARRVDKGLFDGFCQTPGVERQCIHTAARRSSAVEPGSRSQRRPVAAAAHGQPGAHSPLRPVRIEIWPRARMAG